MGAPARQPEYKTITVRCRSKKRMSVLKESALLELMEKVGVPISAEPRMMAEAGGRLVGIYVLETNNVVEIYDRGNDRVGFVFKNLDVWISHLHGVDNE